MPELRSDADKDAVRKCVGRVMGKLFKAGNVVAVAAHHVERGARFVQWDNASDGGAASDRGPTRYGKSKTPARRSHRSHRSQCHTFLENTGIFQKLRGLAAVAAVAGNEPEVDPALEPLQSPGRVRAPKCAHVQGLTPFAHFLTAVRKMVPPIRWATGSRAVSVVGVVWFKLGRRWRVGSGRK